MARVATPFATIKIYGSNELIEETFPLKTAVEALTDVVSFDMETRVINGQINKEYDVISFLGGLQLSFSSTSTISYNPESLEQAYPSTYVDIRSYYNASVLDKRYHYADFSEYNLLPQDVIDSIGGSLKLMSVNFTSLGITHIPERGTKSKVFELTLREFD